MYGIKEVSNNLFNCTCAKLDRYEDKSANCSACEITHETFESKLNYLIAEKNELNTALVSNVSTLKWQIDRNTKNIKTW